VTPQSARESVRIVEAEAHAVVSREIVSIARRARGQAQSGRLDDGGRLR